MQSYHKTIGCLIGAYVLALSLTGRAALSRHEFPNADNSYDLARIEAWGAGGFPTENEAATLTTAFGTYHVSSNVNLNALWAYLYSTPTTNVIDQSDYPDVMVTLPQGIGLQRPNMNLTLRGGKWDMKNTGELSSSGGFNVGPHGSLTLDGVMATNVSNMSAAYMHDGSCFVVTNGSHIVTDGFYMFRDYAYNSFYGQFDSEVKLTANNNSAKYFYLAAKAGYGNKVVFSGAATRFELMDTAKSPYSYVFSGDNGPYDNLIQIENGAQLLLNNALYFSSGNGAPHGNRLVVTGEGSLLTTGDFVANVAGGWNNSIEVSDGAAVRMKETSSLSMSADVSLVISNGTVKCKSFYLGQTADDHGCRVFVKGEHSVIDVASFNFFNKGYGHLWEIDGAHLDYPNVAPNWSAQSISLSSNVVRLVNGASAKFLYLCIPMWNKATPTSHGNEVFVGDSSTLELVQQMRVMNEDNRVVISNGTLVVNAAGESNTNLILGYSDNETFTTNCMLVLQGTHPKVRSGRSVLIENDSVLRLELPERNLRLTEPLVEVASLGSNTGKPHLDVTGWKSYQENLEKSVDIPVVKATQTIDPSYTAAIAEANAKLTAEGARNVYFYRPQGTNEIHLRVRRLSQGMVIQFR